MDATTLNPVLSLFGRVMKQELVDYSQWLISTRSRSTGYSFEFLATFKPESGSQNNFVIGGSYVNNRFCIDIISNWKLRIVCTSSNILACFQAAQGILRKGIINHVYVRHTHPLIGIASDVLEGLITTSSYESDDKYLNAKLAGREINLGSSLTNVDLFKFSPHVMIDTLGGFNPTATGNSEPDSLLDLTNWTRFTENRLIDATSSLNEENATRSLKVQTAEEVLQSRKEFSFPVLKNSEYKATMIVTIA